MTAREEAEKALAKHDAIGPLWVEELSGQIARDDADDLASALRALLSVPETENWEYAPGHHWIDKNGEGHWFVQAGTISPGYVQEYMAQGREAIRRRVGPWEPVPVEEDNR